MYKVVNITYGGSHDFRKLSDAVRFVEDSGTESLYRIYDECNQHLSFIPERNARNVVDETICHIDDKTAKNGLDDFSRDELIELLTDVRDMLAETEKLY